MASDKVSMMTLTGSGSTTQKMRVSPSAITDSSVVKQARSSKLSPMEMRVARRQRARFPAPQFWLTNVVAVRPKALIKQ